MITINELRGGTRAFVTLPELAKLLGLSKVSIYRRNWEGGWLPFFRDPANKKIFYRSDDVLAHIDEMPKHLSTASIESNRRIEYMARARDAKKQNSLKTATNAARKKNKV